MRWMHRLRLRVLALLVAATLAAIGVASAAAWPVWPVLGFAAAAVALVVNRMAARLDGPTCLSCGSDLSRQPTGEYGVICPVCGSISDSRRA
jgi:predicted RNA-binding Zn-ribbon protein involved in translation (DUF1610 family)